MVETATVLHSYKVNYVNRKTLCGLKIMKFFVDKILFRFHNVTKINISTDNGVRDSKLNWSF